MNVVRIIFALVLLTLVFGDKQFRRRNKSKSRNSIRKSNKNGNEKQRKIKNQQNSVRELDEMSRNAFKNGKFTKSLEQKEEYEEYEDDDYFYDDPVIEIRFKRDTNFMIMDEILPRESLLIQKMLLKF